MSYQNFDQYQGQAPQQEAAGAVPANAAQQNEAGPQGQGMENPQAGFQGPNAGDPGSAGSQGGGEMKTTLWSVASKRFERDRC
jgi:hypothetical protein